MLGNAESWAVADSPVADTAGPAGIVVDHMFVAVGIAGTGRLVHIALNPVDHIVQGRMVVVVVRIADTGQVAHTAVVPSVQVLLRLWGCHRRHSNALRAHFDVRNLCKSCWLALPLMVLR